MNELPARPDAAALLPDPAAAVQAAVRSGDAAALRAAWQQAMAGLVPSAGPDDPDPGSCRARSALMDELVGAAVAVTGAEGATFVAAGGYGRRELAPGSDVDLLVLTGPGVEPGPVEAALRVLWDAGLEVGHAVRDLAGARTSLERDLSAATATLEGRFLAGDRERFRALREEVEGFLARSRDRFARAKLAEADERHRRRGGTVCLLAPDLKAGRGTGRDFQLARLLAVLHAPSPGAADPDRVLPALASPDGALEAWLGLEPAEAAALSRAGDLLLACRSAVHELGEEPSDRLTPALQVLLAARFGCEDREERLAVEVFMDDVYRALKRVDLALQRCRLRLGPRSEAVFMARPLAPGVAALGDEVVLDPPGPVDDPTLLAALFLQAQRTRRGLGPATLEDVRRSLLRVSTERLRREPAVLQALREVLGGTRGVAPVVRAMHESGYLGAVLPEFGALECLSQADPYHAYTVDEHTLAALAALEGEPALPDGGGPSPPPAPQEREDLLREDLLHRATRRDLLRLGLLLHDAGKVSGALGHVERGVALVPTVAWRLGLDPEEERHVRFLVREHLTLSSLAEKRDIDAPETLTALLEAVDRDPERLDHLYLLTVADIRAVSPRAMSRWKDTLITRLFERAREALASGVRAVRRPDSVEAWVVALTPRVDDPGALRAHLERCTRAYLADVHPEEVLLHLALARELEAGGASCVVRCSLDAGCERVWVAARDRPRLLADLCGALTGSGLEILGVTTFERRDGVVFDAFAVAAEPGAAPPAERWPRLQAALRGVVDGTQTAEDLLAAHARRQPPAEPTGRRPPVRIRISNEVSPDLSVIDVSAPDRVGLLYELTGALSREGCDIKLAKIATKGDRAVDVFYVTGRGGAQLDDEARRGVMRALAAAAKHPEDRAP